MKRRRLTLRKPGRVELCAVAYCPAVGPEAGKLFVLGTDCIDSSPLCSPQEQQGPPAGLISTTPYSPFQSMPQQSCYFMPVAAYRIAERVCKHSSLLYLPLLDLSCWGRVVGCHAFGAPSLELNRFLLRAEMKWPRNCRRLICASNRSFWAPRA